jgi:hypothetical protein
LFPDNGLLTVYNRVKVQVDLQADKPPVVVKGPFSLEWWTQVIEFMEQMCDARVDLVKLRNLDLQEVKPMHLILKNNSKMNQIY